MEPDISKRRFKRELGKRLRGAVEINHSLTYVFTVILTYFIQDLRIDLSLSSDLQVRAVYMNIPAIPSECAV